MKKTLTALAVLGAFAGTAVAADVTLYGKVDAGLNYQNVEVESATGHADLLKDQDTFAMKSGQNSGSRFGIKGTEDLGNGMVVGFVLENGFNSDDATFNDDDGRLFDRQATLFVKGGFGEIAFGRVGGLASGLGSYSSVYNNTATGTGWGSYAGAKAEFGLSRGRMDNTITYKSPEFAGVTVLAQYSFQMSGDEVADSGANKRYAALGVNYKLGAFSADLVVDSVMPSNVAPKENPDKANMEDSLGVTVGAAYDFGFMKLMGMAQYAKNDTFGDFTTFLGNNTEGQKGYRLALGATAPVATGTVFAQVNYLDAENEKFSNAEYSGYGLFAGYEYPLSARTKVYAFAGYNDFEMEWSATDSADKTQTEVGFGMVHNF